MFFLLKEVFILDKEQIISEVLIKCQAQGETVIVGGYIRNKLLGYDFKDVDLLTTCRPEELKTLFPQLNWTEQGLELGITRMTYRGIQFEFSSCFKEAFKDKLEKRDFTINQFYFDGHNLTSQSTGANDIELKLLKASDYLQNSTTECLKNSPQAFIRAFRFVSLYELKWDESLLTLFQNNRNSFNTVPDGRLQNEAYEILKGKNILRSIYYYEQVGLISTNPKLEEMQDVQIPLYTQNLAARLIYLSYLLGKQTVIEWLTLHHLSQKLIEEIQLYLPYLKTDNLKIHPKKLPFMTLLKRYQYQDDKEKIKDFLKNSR
ncbi:hypothetical protein C1N61_28515 (plasmid) [Priestia aryabhattai]